MTTKRMLAAAATVVAMGSLVACGGGGSSSTAPTVVSTPTPSAAAVTASGAGYVVVHPSKYSTWTYAIETPIRIRESGGGRAKWNFARVSMVRGGREIERAEIGADILASPPDWSNITANQNTTYNLIYRFNSNNFDRIDVTLGFTDVNSGRQFTVDLPFGSFSGVDISLVAMSEPVPAVHRLP
jgi:hypothetical protein